MKKALSPEEKKALLITLKARFEKNMHRHKDILWADIAQKLNSNESKLWSLYEMERTGGEPDVVAFDAKTGQFVFFDCAEESPKGRRSLCYDKAGWEARKEHRPQNTAVEMADEMGIELLDETQYWQLQQLGNFDTKTSSWIKTPEEIRKLGGAIFGDFRYGQTFIYHNGAQSYYAARAFRGFLKV